MPLCVRACILLVCACVCARLCVWSDECVVCDMWCACVQPVKNASQRNNCVSNITPDSKYDEIEVIRIVYVIHDANVAEVFLSVSNNVPQSDVRAVTSHVHGRCQHCPTVTITAEFTPESA